MRRSCQSGRESACHSAQLAPTIPARQQADTIRWPDGERSFASAQMPYLQTETRREPHSWIVVEPEIRWNVTEVLRRLRREMAPFSRTHYFALETSKLLKRRES